MTLENVINDLRNSPYVYERTLGDYISSFNFTRSAFWDRHWTNITTKARGLFIDTKNMRVKARSYNKFFNLDERRETELQNICETWEYPITAYVKENGYLGICSWNEDGTLFCASKSTREGIFAERFRAILEATLGENVEKFARHLQKENLSAVFEVIDPEYDTHIIEYNKPKVILLDLVYNEREPGDLNFLNKSYEILETWGTVFGLEIKKRAAIIWDTEELENFIYKVIAPGYQYNGKWIEGFVLEDIDMRHVKIKTEHYNYWKSWRPVITAVRKGNKVKTERINFDSRPESKRILWLIEKYASQYYNAHGKDMSLITLQHLYKKNFDRVED